MYQIPKGLIRDLEKFAALAPSGAPQATAMRDAACLLKFIRTGQTDSKRLDDEQYELKGYRIDTDPKLKQMRIVFFGKPAQRDVRGYMELSTNEAYEFSGYLLKNYDTLEGIK